MSMKKLKGTKVKDFARKKPITVSHDSDLYDAARVMNMHDIERLPVVQNKKLVGIVTRKDVIKALSKIGS